MAGKPSNMHPRGYSEYYVVWRGNTPLLYPPSPLISHPLPALKSMQKMVNWSLVEHGLEVTKHLRHPHLQGTKGDMGWGYPLLGFYCRVISREFQGQTSCKRVFHKAAELDILWLGSLPTRILGGTVIIRGFEG